MNGVSQRVGAGHFTVSVKRDRSRSKERDRNDDRPTSRRARHGDDRSYLRHESPERSIQKQRLNYIPTSRIEIGGHEDIPELAARDPYYSEFGFNDSNNTPKNGLFRVWAEAFKIFQKGCIPLFRLLFMYL